MAQYIQVTIEALLPLTPFPRPLTILNFLQGSKFEITLHIPKLYGFETFNHKNFFFLNVTTNLKTKLNIFYELKMYAYLSG